MIYVCQTVADPGFPAGGRGLPRRLRFENFVCQNERIWTLGGHAPGTPPLDPPMPNHTLSNVNTGYGLAVTVGSQNLPEAQICQQQIHPNMSVDIVSGRV